MKLKLETLKSHKDAAQKLQQQLHDGNTKAFDLEANITVLQVRMLSRGGAASCAAG
jgi:hypothetical protein